MMFEPIGEKSRRLMVVDVVDATPYGDIVTYETLMEALDLDDRQPAQNAVHNSLATIERELSKALEVVPNVGYRIVQPAEHAALARRQQRKAKKSIVRAKSKVDHVDLSKLTDAERAMFTVAASVLGSQLEFARRADLRYARKETVDRFMSDQSSVNARTDDELRAMRERLAQLESHISQEGSSLHADAAPCSEAAPRATSQQIAAVARGASTNLPAPDAG